MIEIYPVTGKLIGLALDAAQMRLDVAANNISNVNTNNYKPLKVDFEDQLEIHKQNLLDKSMDKENKSLLKEISPTASTAEDGYGDLSDNVLIDMQLTELSKTVLHYQALLEARSKIGSLAKMAVTGDIR